MLSNPNRLKPNMSAYRSRLYRLGHTLLSPFVFLSPLNASDSARNLFQSPPKTSAYFSGSSFPSSILDKLAAAFSAFPSDLARCYPSKEIDATPAATPQRELGLDKKVVTLSPRFCFQSFSPRCPWQWNRCRILLFPTPTIIGPRPQQSPPRWRKEWCFGFFFFHPVRPEPPSANQIRHLAHHALDRVN